ncbi:MAG: phosphate transport system regulatory protein PhoU [Bacteroidetes bacterium SW_11_45_7]|nr:MAG: phosphate transport system regulatory protein PhoU [Bacteroidetes bacterium SW_11_45_7]
MTHLEAELDQLKNAVVDMAFLTANQLEKSKEAFIHMDADIAEEVIHNERRVNAMELSIDRDCENIFALFNPVASDLRFVIAVLKINSDLERIADYADGISKYVVDFGSPIQEDMKEANNLANMFDLAVSMTRDITTAFEYEDATLARKVYKKDAELNRINQNASNVISEFVAENTDTIRQMLFLFSTIRKLERVGDHVKNVAEDLVFYLEAEVLKHNKNKKN